MRYLLLLVSAAAWGQASFVSSTGDAFAWPYSYPSILANSGIGTLATLNGASIKAGHCGFVRILAGGSKTLQNLHFRFGSVTKSGGTTLRVGLQAASTTVGPPAQPDGTFLAAGSAFASISNASIPTSNNWFRSGTVGGTLSVSNGDLVCMVVEVDSYAGSDSLVVSGATARNNAPAISSSYNGATWAGSGLLAVHLLEFTDGTFGSIGQAVPFASLGFVATFNSSSTPDEYALKIQPSTSLRVVGICTENPYSTSTGDAELVLYQGTTALATVVVDANQMWSTSAAGSYCGYFSTPITITSGNTYYAALKATTTNNIRTSSSTANNSAYWVVFGGGTETSYSTRTNAGAWSDTATARVHNWLLIDQAGTSGSTYSGAYVVAQ